MENEEKKLQHGRSLKRDIIFILVLILAGSMIAAAVLLCSKTGNYVEVRMGDGTILQFPLDQDREVMLELEDGSYNMLVIKDGAAQVNDASCPDKLCVHMGKIRRTGQSIICLPNRLIVKICTDSNGSNEQDDVDAIVK